MGVEKQDLDKNGQPVLNASKGCLHGVYQDARGNSACESCLDYEKTESNFLGIETGWEQASNWLRLKSGAAFAAARDDEAALLRRLADEAGAFAGQRRADLDRHRKEGP